MEKDKNIMPHFDLFPTAGKIGHAIVRMFSWNMHQLSGQSEHKFDHPLDTELYGEPVCIPEDAPVIRSVPDIRGLDV